MEELIKRLMAKFYPALDAGTVYPRWGEITRWSEDIAEGALADDDEPRFAVDVQPLVIDDASGQLRPDGRVIYASVPLPVAMAGNNRGQFGYPQPGSRVLLQFVQGLPAHPVITGVYPSGRNLPALVGDETLLQHSSATFMRSTDDEDWRLQARNKLWLGNQVVNLVAEVRKLSEWARDHKHAALMKEAVTKAEAGAIASRVASIEK